MEAGKILLGDESNVSNASSVRLQGDRDFGNTTKRTRDNVVVNWNRKVSLFNYEEGWTGGSPKNKGAQWPNLQGRAGGKKLGWRSKQLQLPEAKKRASINSIWSATHFFSSISLCLLADGGRRWSEKMDFRGEPSWKMLQWTQFCQAPSHAKILSKLVKIDLEGLCTYKEAGEERMESEQKRKRGTEQREVGGKYPTSNLFVCCVRGVEGRGGFPLSSGLFSEAWSCNNSEKNYLLTITAFIAV